MARVYKLTDEDIDVIRRSSADPNIFFAHFFKKKDVEKPFQLDYNFAEGKEWQKEFCMAKEHILCAIAGISTGKTLTVIMSAAYFAVKLRSFRFMNIANEQGQSDTMRNFLLDQSKDTLFEKLIAEKPKSPVSKIVLRFIVGDIEYSSELQFRNTGEKNDAKNVMSTRMDWINIEESNLIPELKKVTGALVTRLTGNTAEGRPYLGRLSLIANPTDDNPELWDIYEAAAESPDGRVFNINTEDNKNTTEAQVKFAVSIIGDDDEVEMYMTGNKPKSDGKYFSSSSIARCESIQLDAKLESLIEEGNLNHHKDSRLGYLHWEMPHAPLRQYVVLGDPGTKNAPKRDSPVLGVFDVSKAPQIAPMVGFWWGNGNGTINPFNEMLIQFITKYNPILAGIDSTATQKQFAQVTTATLIEGMGYSINELTPLDFSGGRKYAYLIAARLSLELGMIQYPAGAKGISSQLRMYDPEKDRGSTTKLPQDVVSMLSMAAWVIRGLFPHTVKKSDSDTEEDVRVRRDGRRYSGAVRERRSPR